MITLKNVSKKFGDYEIFNNVNFTLEGNGVYLIRGDSGVGKTTLLNIIANLISSRGLVRNDYLDDMSYVFQNSYLIEHLTIKENLDLYKIDYKILKKYKLYNKLDELPLSLSRGEKSRIAFIIGLYNNSKLLLLDEPITNLDKINAKLVIDEIFKFSKDKIIIVISHENKKFIKRVNGIIDIKNKTVTYKQLFSCNDAYNKSKRKISITKRYLYREYKFYKKEYIKRYLIIFLTFMIMFSFLTIKSLFLLKINEDIENSVDYNKFYVSECSSNKDNGVIIKECKNPSELKLNILKEENIKYGFNYDFLLNNIYSREDLYVVSNKSVNLDKGNYPSRYNEVITNNKYNIGDKINLKANLIVNDIYDDVYNENITLEVVGVYQDLLFFDDNNIYFDYDLVDNYYKNKMLINNNYSIYEYYNKLEIDNYKYIAFNNSVVDYLGFNGNKYEFYESLLEIYKECEKIFDGILLFVFIYSLYLMYRLNKSKLRKTMRSNAFLIANSYGVLKSVLLSMCLDIIVVTLLVGVFSLFSVILKTSILLILIMYVSLIVEILIQTYMYYRKKNVNKLMRIEVW